MESGDITNNEMFKIFFNSLNLLLVAYGFQVDRKRRQDN